jgi:hypothetical protein
MQNPWFNYPFSDSEKEFFILEKALSEDFRGAFYIDLYSSGAFEKSWRLLWIWETGKVAVYYLEFISDNQILLKRGSLNRAEADQILKALSNLKLPIFPNSGGEGRDGHDYRISAGQGAAFFNFQFWNVSMPDDWQPLEALIQKIIAQFKHIHWLQNDIIDYEIVSENERTMLLDSKSLLLNFKLNK